LTDAEKKLLPLCHCSVAGMALVLPRGRVSRDHHFDANPNQSAGAVAGDDNGVLASHRDHAYGSTTSVATKKTSNAAYAIQDVIVVRRTGAVL